MATELTRQARRSAQQQVRTRAIAVEDQTSRTEILNAMSRFSEAVGGEAQRQVRAEIETQNMIGASRAAEDLLVAEENRVGITADATNTQRLAYNTIIGKHDVTSASQEYVNWLNSNPEADAKLKEDKKKELYAPLFGKYGQDPETVKQISLDVQNAQFEIMPLENRIKTDYDKDKRAEAFQIGVGDLLADPSVDMNFMLNQELPERAKSLGMSEFQYKSAVMNEMVNRASSGDARLLNQLKETDWAKNSVLISKAESAHRTFVARENAEIIGDEMGTIEIENKGLNVPWSTTLKKIDKLNDRYPGTYSAARIAQLKQIRDKAISDRDKSTGMMESSFNNLYNEDGLPLAIDGRYSKKEKKDFVDNLDELFAKKTKELIDAGADPATANSVMMKQRLDWSRVNRVKVPLLEQNLNGLLSLNPEDYPNSSDLPEFAIQGFQTIQQMDNATIDLYFPGQKDKAFALNIKSGMSTRDNYSAFKRAYNVKENPYAISNEHRTDVRDAVSTEVEGKLNASLFSELFGGKDVPEWQVGQIKSRVGDIAETNMYNGVFDIDLNAKQSVAEVMKDYSQTFNGTLVNQSKPALASQISTDVVKVHVNKVDDYMEAFTLSVLDLAAEEVGEPVSPEDISYDFSNNGTFVMRYRGGEQIGGRFQSGQIAVVGRDADLESLRKLKGGAEYQRKVDQYSDELYRLDEAHSFLFNEFQ